MALLALLAMALLYDVAGGLGQQGWIRHEAETTGRQLQWAKDALLAYAATYPDSHPNQVFGYFPCPDSDGDGDADSADAACGGNDGKATIGLLPYKTLGLADNQDGSGQCLWYAVSGAFKAATSKAPALNWDTQGQFDIRDAQDAILEAPDDPRGGAAAVVFAVGPPLPGQDRSIGASQPCGVSAAHPAAEVYAQYVDVDPRRADPTLSAPFPGESLAPLRLVQGANVPGRNNDRLVWITPKELWQSILKRKDLSSALDARINALLLDLQAKLSNNLNSYSTAPNRAMPTNLVYGSNTALANDYAAFKDHLRYLRCATANSYCYSLNGAACDGLLLFAGSADAVANGTASPRPSSLRSDAHYFEPAGALPLLAGTTTSLNNAPQNFSNLSPTTDLVLCLTPKPISNSDMMSATNPRVTGYAALVTTTGTNLRLGTPSPSGSVSPLNYYGCFWYPLPQPFGSGLRVYFDYVVSARSEGFTFTLADADTRRNPSTNMCGSHGDALGYAGNNGAVAPIRPPKMAVEFDFATSNPGPLGIDRHDPATAPALHFAIDYWGVDDDGSDDVTHGAGDGMATPRNPSSTPGLAHPSSNIANGTRVYVRLDISRSYSPANQTGKYQIVAYLAKSFSGMNCLSSDFANLSQDLDVLCPSLNTSASGLSMVSDSIALTDLPDHGEAMQKIYLGFTTSMQGGGSQQVNIGNFQAVRR
ncbi:hypothetical protein DLREEDagrD3_23040 [Denitratisoma sp. agr-D3]